MPISGPHASDAKGTVLQNETGEKDPTLLQFDRDDYNQLFNLERTRKVVETLGNKVRTTDYV
jgi:hypothetical protein